MDKIIIKKKLPYKKVLIYAVVILSAITTISIIAFRDFTSKMNVEKEKLLISEVKKGMFQEYIPVTGSIEPFQTIYLDLSSGGKIVKRFVEEGAFLNIGDPIVKLENPELTLQLLNTQSSFMLAESQLSQTRLTFEQNNLYNANQLLDINTRLINQKRIYENNKALYAKGLCAVQEYESAKEQYDYLVKSRELMNEVIKKDSLTRVQLVQQSEANVERSRSYLKLMENQLSDLTVKAPIKGQLTSLKAEYGQSVGAGYRLGQIDNTDSYKIRAEIDEHYISRVRSGLIGEYEFNNKIYSLTLKTVYPQVANGKFAVDMIFNGIAPKEIKRGQTVHIKLQIGGSSEAVMIDNGGFYSKTGGQWIFVMDPSGSFAVKRKIKIGRQNPQCFEVLEGLSIGEKIITSSYENYADVEKLLIK